MSLLVHLDTNHERGAIIAAAIAGLRDGIATLREYEGMRAETIGVSAAKFGTEFGIASAPEAQAFSDRWGAIAAGTYTGLNDFLNATLAGAGSGS